MKIIADQDIPLLSHYFSHCGEIIFKPGRTLTRDDLLNADILLARSVTQINKELLEGTPVKFVGSAVSGIDHIDTAWLDQQGILWADASGCNAIAVSEYIVCVIAALQKSLLLTERNPRIAVIGVGKVGSRVVDKLKALGFDVVQCDPIRAENEKLFQSTRLEDISNVDLITIHTPLTRSGKYPTFHMIEKIFLQQQKQNCILINTARGAVIHSDDLKKQGRHLKWCFDVWENEPNIDKEILNAALIATQHIAGHSIQAKYRGIEMVYQKACALGVIPVGNLSPVPYPRRSIKLSNKNADWREKALAIFNPLDYTSFVKTALLNSEKSFDQLRRDFSDHYEFEFVDFE